MPVFLPETDRVRLIELHRDLDHRKAKLTAMLIAACVLPAATAVTLAVVRPDPESAAWFAAGLAWAGLGTVFVVRDIRRRRWAIHDETPGLKLRARPRGPRDRLSAAAGGLALIACGLLLWDLGFGAIEAAQHEPGRPLGWFLRVRVIACEPAWVLPGVWWECEIDPGTGWRTTVVAQFGPADMDEPVRVLYEPAEGFSRLDVPAYGVFSLPAAATLQLAAVGVIGWGVVRTMRRPLLRRDRRPDPGLPYFAPDTRHPAVPPDMIDGVPAGAHHFAIDDVRENSTTWLGHIALYSLAAGGVALMCAWALLAGGKTWAAALLGVGRIMPWLFGTQARAWTARRDAPVAYALYGRFLYIRRASGVVTADLHDPRVRVETNSRMGEPISLRLALPGRHLPHDLAITADETDMLALAAVLDRSPFAHGRRAATKLLSRTGVDDVPEVPGLDTESAPLAAAHLRRRPVWAAFLAGLLIAVVAADLVVASDYGFGTAWLLCLPAALVCGPLGYAALVSLTWGAPAKRRTAGTPWAPAVHVRPLLLPPDHVRRSPP